MRFLTISDTHVRETTASDRGWSILQKAKDMAVAETPDLVLFGGDLAEPGTGTLSPAIQLLASFEVPVLWVIGNNDLESLETTRLSEYERIAQSRVRGTHVHILDAAPFIHKGVAFIGNYVGYDGSLYHAPTSARAQELRQKVADIHTRFGLDLSPQKLFEKCLGQLKRDLQGLPPEMPKVVCTHTVPHKGFLLYGHSLKYDDYNYGMGWEDTFIGAVPGLRYQLCGHTHRSAEVVRPGLPPITNISGLHQPRIFTL